MALYSLWVIQWLFNIAAVGLLAWSFWRRRAQTQGTSGERVTAYLNVLESRAEQWEAESEKFRTRCEAQLKCLTKICDEAQSILEKGRLEAMLPPSQEERELRDLARWTASETKSTDIPSLAQLEQTRLRLKEEATVDLRTVLNDQLG